LSGDQRITIAIAINITFNMLVEKLWNKSADEDINNFQQNIVFSQSYFHFHQNITLP
jgi:hypothetical protein